MPARFPLGRLLATPAAIRAMHDNDTSPALLIARHLTLDPGDLCLADQRANADALIHGARVFSSFRLVDGTRIWLITEADRSSTTILLPEDY